jgi:hypothetical protein
MKTAQRLTEEKIKQEASGLVLSYLAILGHKWDEVYECAYITADKILETLQKGHPTDLVVMPMDMIDYWIEVKKEIQKLKNK